MAMAKLGAIPGDGGPHASLAPLDREARRILIGWGGAMGLSASVDLPGNLFLRHQGGSQASRPC